MFIKSPGFGLGMVGSSLTNKLGLRASPEVYVNRVDPDWLAGEKTKADQEGRVPFVSANDALTSWFFRQMAADTNIMIVNFRNRRPSILGLADHHAGNYEAVLPYFTGDVETTALIRLSIRDSDGGFRARRAGSPSTGIPGFRTKLRNRVSLITNWSTFYRDLHLPGSSQDDEEGVAKPKLHLPLLVIDGVITSCWNTAIIFRPRSGELGLLMVTNRLEGEIPDRHQDPGGQDAPLGDRLV